MLTCQCFRTRERLSTYIFDTMRLKVQYRLNCELSKAIAKLFSLSIYAKFQIAPLKAVIGVDRPMNAPSMHIQKPYLGKIVQVLTAVILSKIIFSKPNSFMHMFNVSTLYRQSIELLHQKLW